MAWSLSMDIMAFMALNIHEEIALYQINAHVFAEFLIIRKLAKKQVMISDTNPCVGWVDR